MEDFESRLGQLLADKEMMGKIMAMAQNLGGDPPAQPPPQEQPGPEPDLNALRQLTGLMGKAGVDRDQKALLAALAPYISAPRLQKLERAMRAAKLAGVATAFLGDHPLL